MPKLNLIGMVVLCLAVAGGAAVMALRTGAPRVDAPRLDRLIRRLGDTDADLRRDAERELKALGSKAEPALKEAANGPDLAVAQRARLLLGLKPASISAEKPQVVAKDPVSETGIRLTLQIASAPRRPEEPVLYYLRLHNDTKRAVIVLRDSKFGRFERIDAEGRLVELEGVSSGDESVDLVTVAAGEAVDLAPRMGMLRIAASGTFKVRFVYDASEGSEYCEDLATGHHAGTALPAERIVSNSVTLTVP